MRNGIEELVQTRTGFNTDVQDRKFDAVVPKDRRFSFIYANGTQHAVSLGLESTLDGGFPFLKIRGDRNSEEVHFGRNINQPSSDRDILAEALSAYEGEYQARMRMWGEMPGQIDGILGLLHGPFSWKYYAVGTQTDEKLEPDSTHYQPPRLDSNVASFTTDGNHMHSVWFKDARVAEDFKDRVQIKLVTDYLRNMGWLEGPGHSREIRELLVNGYADKSFSVAKAIDPKAKNNDYIFYPVTQLDPNRIEITTNGQNLYQITFDDPMVAKRFYKQSAHLAERSYVEKMLIRAHEELPDKLLMLVMRDLSAIEFFVKNGCLEAQTWDANHKRNGYYRVPIDQIYEVFTLILDEVSRLYEPGLSSGVHVSPDDCLCKVRPDAKKLPYENRVSLPIAA